MKKRWMVFCLGICMAVSLMACAKPDTEPAEDAERTVVPKEETSGLLETYSILI